jgi:hypothetical protein
MAATPYIYYSSECRTIVVHVCSENPTNNEIKSAGKKQRANLISAKNRFNNIGNPMMK